MVAWDRKETSLSGEELYTDSSPGLWESLSLDPEVQDELGLPMVQAVDRLQDMVGNGLQAILSGDWQQLMGLVDDAPEHHVDRSFVSQGPDVVPI